MAIGVAGVFVPLPGVSGAEVRQLLPLFLSEPVEAIRSQIPLLHRRAAHGPIRDPEQLSRVRADGPRNRVPGAGEARIDLERSSERIGVADTVATRSIPVRFGDGFDRPPSVPATDAA